MSTISSAGTEDAQARPVLHTKEEAAAILRLKVSWLERRAAERKIPFTMLGGRYMFTDGHLAEIVRLYEQGPEGSHEKPTVATRRRRRAQQQPRSTRADVAPLVPRPKGGVSRPA